MPRGRKRKTEDESNPPPKRGRKKKARYDLKLSKRPTIKVETPPFHIQNVVATFNLGLDSLDLRELALQKGWIEFNPHKFAAATLRLREPRTTALAFASGNMVCTGAKDELTSMYASRRYVRLLQRHGVPVLFKNFKIQNIVASSNVGHAMKLKELAECFGPYVSYECDLFPGLVFRTSEPKLVFLIFRSGTVVITGAKTREEIGFTFNLLYQNVLVNFFDDSDTSTSSSEYRKKLRNETMHIDDFHSVETLDELESYL